MKDDIAENRSCFPSFVIVVLLQLEDANTFCDRYFIIILGTLS